MVKGSVSEHEVKGWIGYEDRAVLHISEGCEVDDDIFDKETIFAVIERQQVQAILDQIEPKGKRKRVVRGEAINTVFRWELEQDTVLMTLSDAPSVDQLDSWGYLLVEVKREAIEQIYQAIQDSND